MKIIEKNEGVKIPYVVKTTKITLDDELMMNLERYERDDPNHIDICRDKCGNLVSGVIPGMAEKYVAQIDIPARDYDYIADGIDGDGKLRELQIPIPFNMDNCTLTLWAI